MSRVSVRERPRFLFRRLGGRTGATRKRTRITLRAHIGTPATRQLARVGGPRGGAPGGMIGSVRHAAACSLAATGKDARNPACSPGLSFRRSRRCPLRARHTSPPSGCRKISLIPGSWTAYSKFWLACAYRTGKTASESALRVCQLYILIYI